MMWTPNLLISGTLVGEGSKEVLRHLKWKTFGSNILCDLFISVVIARQGSQGSVQQLLIFLY